MTIEIRKIFDALDEQLMKYHTKIAGTWEKKGHSKYTLSTLLSASSALTTPALLVRYTDRNSIIYGAYSGITGVFYCDHWKDNHNKKNDDYDILDEEKAESLDESNKKQIRKFFRFPLFISGLFHIGKGAVELTSSYFNGDGQTMREGTIDMAGGYGLISLSSALYIKDTDPKILEKSTVLEKLLENANECIKESIDSILPQPELKPVSMEN